MFKYIHFHVLFSRTVFPLHPTPLSGTQCNLTWRTSLQLSARMYTGWGKTITQLCSLLLRLKGSICLLNEPSCFQLHFHVPQFSRSVVSDSLRPHESQHARPPCPSPTPGVHSDSTIESVMPSSHLILWRPLLLLPPIPPSIKSLFP